MSTPVKIISVILFAGLLLVTNKAYDMYKMMDPKPLKEWQASDAENTARIDHQLWQQILTDNVEVNPETGINLFKYANFSDADYEKLESYLEYAQSICPLTYNDAEQMAYWINLYNAITIKVIVDEYPVDSIKQTGEGLPGLGPWDDVTAVVDGKELTLNNIEHNILRRVWSDNRIHYGVNCASIGCPNLANQAYTADNLDSLLDTMAAQFINHPRGVHYDAATNTLTLSSIFNWFVSDFGGNEKALLVDLQRHAKPELKAILAKHTGKIKYDYDWRLNGSQAE
jgi:hypothetical protein